MKLVNILLFLSSVCLALGNQDFVTHEEFKEVLSKLEITSGKLHETTLTLAETTSAIAEVTSNLAKTLSELNELKGDFFS